MFAAMGTEARLRIVRLLLSAHPDGLVVSEIQSELEIPNSTLSHHLEKLKNKIWSRSTGMELFSGTRPTHRPCRKFLSFLYAECCTRNKAIKPEAIVQLCK